MDIRQFDFKKIKSPARILIFGESGTGKSTIIKRILWQLKNRVRIPILLSKTALMTGEYPMIPESNILNTYDVEKIQKFLNYSGNICFKKHEKDPQFKGKVISNLLILDDILGDPKWANDKTLEHIMYMGRHADLGVILSVQYAMAVKSALRDNFQYIFITGAQSANVKKKIFEHYWNESKFGDRSIFNRVFDACTAGHNSLVIDRPNISTSKNLTDCIFFAIPPPVEIYPPYRLGAPGLWKLYEKYYDENWKKKLFTQQEETKKKTTEKISINLIKKDEEKRAKKATKQGKNL